MMTGHRHVYYLDVGLFLLLATPVLNMTLLDFLMDFGTARIVGTEQRQLVAGLLGLFGLMGLALASIRLAVQDSRAIVSLSAATKILASGWLSMLFLWEISDAFAVLAALDAVAAVTLVASLTQLSTPIAK